MNSVEVNYPFNLEARREPAPNFAVLTPFEFLADFRLETQRAKERVWGQAMDMQTGHPGSAFFHIFEEAVKKGLDTRLNIDWFSRLSSEPGINIKKDFPLLGNGYHRFCANRNDQTYRRLSEVGVKVNFLNSPASLQRVLPFFGRNHIKMYIVDNIAWIGGVNISDASFKGIDFVVKVTDQEIVEALIAQFARVNENKPKKDYKVDFSDGSSLIIDRGKPGESLVLDTAANLVDSARQSVRNISFFTPDGKFLRTLKKAQNRGVDVEVLMPTVVEGVYKLINLWNRFFMGVKRQRIPFKKFDGRLHAKLLIVDGQIVMFGSHNLMQSGVRAGTEEIALLSGNPELVTSLVEFYETARKGV